VGAQAAAGRQALRAWCQRAQVCSSGQAPRAVARTARHAAAMPARLTDTHTTSNWSQSITWDRGVHTWGARGRELPGLPPSPAARASLTAVPAAHLDERVRAPARAEHEHHGLVLLDELQRAVALPHQAVDRVPGSGRSAGRGRGDGRGARAGGQRVAGPRGARAHMRGPHRAAPLVRRHALPHLAGASAPRLAMRAMSSTVSATFSSSTVAQSRFLGHGSRTDAGGAGWRGGRRRGGGGRGVAWARRHMCGARERQGWPMRGALATRRRGEGACMPPAAPGRRPHGGSLLLQAAPAAAVPAPAPAPRRTSSGTTLGESSTEVFSCWSTGAWARTRTTRATRARGGAHAAPGGGAGCGAGGAPRGWVGACAAAVRARGGAGQSRWGAGRGDALRAAARRFSRAHRGAAPRVSAPAWPHLLAGGWRAPTRAQAPCRPCRRPAWRGSGALGGPGVCRDPVWRGRVWVRFYGRARSFECSRKRPCARALRGAAGGGRDSRARNSDLARRPPHKRPPHKRPPPPPPRPLRMRRVTAGPSVTAAWPAAASCS
jgi:hypothetical protein